MSVAVHASSEDAALAGLGDPPVEPAVVVALGDAEVPAGTDRDRVVRWLARPPSCVVPERVIAPGGERLWRRAPWPVADPLFDLHPRHSGPALVVGGAPADRDGIVAELLERGDRAVAEERITARALAEAAVVVFAGDAAGALPGEAMAVLAARRVLVTPRSEPAFGLIPAVDWFPGTERDDLVDLAHAALAYPEAFDVPRALGRIAAERHRASVVYPRLAADLEAERAAA